MLSRSVKRACIDNRQYTTIPTFLVPAFARLSTASQNTGLSPALDADIHAPSVQTATSPKRPTTVSTPHVTSPSTITRASPKTVAPDTKPLDLSPSIRQLLPALSAQSPHYITAHIHGRPYLVTEGDSIRLPFRMPDVEPGDILRLTCATNLGSRDFTLKAAADASQEHGNSGSSSSSEIEMQGEDVNQASHFVYNRLAGMTRYLDPRMYVCRAVVTGTEAEPMRVKEKTKRRQRRVKTVKSKHRYTVLRIKELRIKTLEELDAE